MNKTVIAIGLFGLLFGLLYWQFPYALKGADNKANLIYFMVLAASIVVSISSSKLSGSTILRYSTVWISLAIVLLLVYNFKGELLGVLIPNRPQVHKDNSFVITLSQDKHFHIEVVMNETSLDCLVDTGASAIVVDTNDAKLIGIDINELNFTAPSETANGIIYSARTILPYMKIGDIELYNKEVSINKSNMRSCLLGMSFLSTLKKISIEGDKMILSPQ